MIEIKHRVTGAVLYRNEGAATTREAVLAAVAARAYLRDAYLRDADLSDAYLSGAYLSGADLSGAYLSGADLRDADLSDADLSDAYLSGAYLSGADLSGAYLSGAYLRDAKNVPASLADHTDPSEPYVRAQTSEERAARAAARALRYRERHPDVPVVEALDAKILALVEAGTGELEMATWHTCETTHCRAGWAIHLAGKAGYDLEAKLGDPAKAGRAIYTASVGHAPHFYASNERALEDIKRCAAEQTAAPVAASSSEVVP